MNVLFDKIKIFNEEIKPILLHLQSLLEHYNIPYFFAAAIKSDGEKTQYFYENHDIWTTSAMLADDKIPEFIKVANGFKTVLPDEIKADE